MDFFKTNDNQRIKSNFRNSIIFPFLSGVLGASVVLSISCNVPQIKNQLFNLDDTIASLNSKIESIETSSNNQSGNYITTSSNTTSSSLISLANYSNATSELAQKVQPSVVGISVSYNVNTMFNQSSTATVTGSGIIISEDGYILTNNHIINSTSDSYYYSLSNAKEIQIYLYNDSTPYSATIVGTDDITDLAVLKIEKTNLPAAELGNSDTVKSGAFAMAIGNPLGLENSVTLGTVSSANREVKATDGITYNLIQTDAAINSGNSGGALVDAEGKIIGVNTLKASGTDVEGIGFAIPINTCKTVLSQLIEYGKVKRPYLGISYIILDDSTAKRNNLVVGLYVKSVEDFSGAQKGGLQAGDVITEINGKDVSTIDSLDALIYSYSIGDTLSIKINRNGEEKTLSIILGEKN